MKIVEQNCTTGEIVERDHTIQEAAQYSAWADHAEKQFIKDKIAALEASITPRRVREHILGINTTFIPQKEEEIFSLRGAL